MSNIARDENKIYQVVYGKEGWVWARFDVKQWRYLAYEDIDSAILCVHPLVEINSDYLYNAVKKGDLVI